jgi:hypothetical protein
MPDSSTPAWLAASAAFFVYVLACAPFVRRLPRLRRVRASAAAAAGLALCALTAALPFTPVVHEWIAPPVLLLAAYWSSGLLFAGPMPRWERRLNAIDDRLRVDARAAGMARPLRELLEAAYAGVYPLIPCALAVHVLMVPQPDPARFWTVVLVTDYLCFGTLPWIQTRPPRAFRPDPWTSPIRRFNLRMLGAASIRVNTFPSGHAAEALAAALLVAAAPWPWSLALGVAALLVTAATVFGRYHYAADALAGWAVALLVWGIA